MTSRPPDEDTADTYRSWPLPSAATLGSAVRARGILLEIRARLPYPVRRLLDIQGTTLSLRLRDGDEDDAAATAGIVEKALAALPDIAVIPREIEDILSITSTERRRWLEDGRLPSAGTRTIRLKGRARRITFHVFDPKVVEDVLDRGLVDEWREEDAEAKAERRRQAAYKRRMAASSRKSAKTRSAKGEPTEVSNGLKDWDEFQRNGLLR